MTRDEVAVETGPPVRLTCIARREAHRMQGLAASVRGVVDDAVFVLNGEDDDGTETAALSSFGAAGIPCSVFRSRLPSFDFGSARNEMLEIAAKPGVWLLVLDPDSPIVGRLPVGWADDQMPARELSVRQDGTEWWMPYLVASEAVFAGARYVGRAHEYLDLSACIRPDRTLIRLDSPFVDRKGASADEERKRWYLRMLREDLAEDPKDARAAFYIANTLRDLGRVTEALDAYLRRAAIAGFVEETFLSIFEAGLCLARLNENPTAMRVLLGAAQFRPTRPEPLHALARLANLHGEHMSAFAFAERGMLIPPTTDSLFVRRSVHTWGLALERAVAVWWLGRQNEAYGEFERLLSLDDVPEVVRERIRANLANRDTAR